MAKALCFSMPASLNGLNYLPKKSLSPKNLNLLLCIASATNLNSRYQRALLRLSPPPPLPARRGRLNGKYYGGWVKFPQPALPLRPLPAYDLASQQRLRIVRWPAAGARQALLWPAPKSAAAQGRARTHTGLRWTLPQSVCSKDSGPRLSNAHKRPQHSFLIALLSYLYPAFRI